jgi:hypothetical protein
MRPANKYVGQFRKRLRLKNFVPAKKCSDIVSTAMRKPDLAEKRDPKGELNRMKDRQRCIKFCTSRKLNCYNCTLRTKVFLEPGLKPEHGHSQPEIIDIVPPPVEGCSACIAYLSTDEFSGIEMVNFPWASTTTVFLVTSFDAGHRIEFSTSIPVITIFTPEAPFPSDSRVAVPENVVLISSSPHEMQIQKVRRRMNAEIILWGILKDK